MEHKILSRRSFLTRALVGAAGVMASAPYVLASQASGRRKRASPSERITLGFIGLGSHGFAANLRGCLAEPDAQVVALCDVDNGRLLHAHEFASKAYAGAVRSAGFKGIMKTRDWREIASHKGIDAVVVSTPDHWHVLPSVQAIGAGKDVLCEKPLSLTVQEGRALSDAVRRAGAVFQTGSPNRSKVHIVRACEAVRNGRIGKLLRIRTWLHALPLDSLLARPTPRRPVPEGLDWNMWLGPAPWREYVRLGPNGIHGRWRWISDFSGGTLTDHGAHHLDIAQWGNGTDRTGPVRVEGKGVFAKHSVFNTAKEFEITYEYANGVRLICQTTQNGSNSVRFEGSQGWIHVRWGSARASSPRLLKPTSAADRTKLRTCPAGEVRDFLNCVKNRKDPYSPAEVGHRTASLCHLGNIAMLLGRKLQWDPDAERFAADEEANRMLSRTMRTPLRL